MNGNSGNDSRSSDQRPAYSINPSREKVNYFVPEYSLPESQETISIIPPYFHIPLAYTILR